MVLFQEDALACILVLDGYYLEGRSIRASFGTSKYCSAFIKNVRCNNPECTYLHEMGAMEDTFTKQEIQAGYVTSGRDVLARQQQLVQQALSESQGAAGSAPRKRVGGGGPSGTGRASSHPVFPPPEFDEPAKPSLVPAPVGVSRAASTGTGFPNIGGASKMTRSASTGASKPIPVSASQAAAILPIPANKKGAGSNPTLPPPQPATAASVVAGVHSFGQAAASAAAEAPAPHTTLTPLTPLKRTSKPTSAPSTSSKASAGGDTKATTPANKKTPAKKSNGGTRGGSVGPAPVSPISQPPTSPSAPTGSTAVEPSSLNDGEEDRPSSLSSLGGEIIAAPSMANPVPGIGAIGSSFSSGGGSVGSNNMAAPIGSSALRELNDTNDILDGQPIGLGSLGGEVFTGPLKGSAIGSGKDRWSGSSGQFNSGGSIGSGFNNNNANAPDGGALWNNNGLNPQQQQVQGTNVIGGVGGSVIGPQGSSSGSFMGNNPLGGMQGGRNSGSSALASLLGINLPNSSQLNGPAPSEFFQGAPGSNPAPIGPGNLGGVPIGGNPLGPQGGIGGGIIGGGGGGAGPIGGATIGGPNPKNDIALLQSLLPEVHITSGNVGTPGFPGQQQSHQWGSSGAAAAPVGRNSNQQAQRQGAGGNIW